MQQDAVLVLATREDETSKAIAEDLNALGVRTELVTDIDDVLLAVISDCNGASMVSIRRSSSQVEASALLYRGLSASYGMNAFMRSEWLAAWWSALALFRGPVINRANRDGLVPALDGAARPLPLAFVPAQFSASLPEVPTEGKAINVYDLKDGSFHCRLEAGRPLRKSASHGPYRMMTFDPRNISHVIVVGGQAYFPQSPFENGWRRERVVIQASYVDRSDTRPDGQDREEDEAVCDGPDR